MPVLFLVLSLLLMGCGGGGDEAPQTIAPAVDPPPDDPPPPERVTLTFNGTFSCGSTVTGTFSYLKDAAFHSSNVRGLSPNFIYPLISWSFTGDSRCDGLPSSTFKNGEPGQLVEFCVGQCQFSDALEIQLSLTNQTDNVVMQLVWGLPEHVPSHRVPQFADFGPFQQSLYRVPCPICSPVGIFQIGVLLEPPANPANEGT